MDGAALQRYCASTLKELVSNKDKSLFLPHFFAHDHDKEKNSDCTWKYIALHFVAIDSSENFEADGDQQNRIAGK